MSKNELYKEIANDVDEVNNLVVKIVAKIIEYLDSIDDKDLIKQKYININTNNWEKICDVYIKKFKVIEGNIYFLYDSNKNLKYIGTSSEESLNKRIKEHFFKKSEKTSSQLENVKNHILNENGTCMYYNAISVSGLLRTSIEDALIDNRNTEWNQRNNNK